MTDYFDLCGKLHRSFFNKILDLIKKIFYYIWDNENWRFFL